MGCMIQTRWMRSAGLLLLGLLWANAGRSTELAAAEIRPERVPESGLQPDARVDAQGRVHLVYLSGDPKAADIHRVSRGPGRGEWSRPQTVNSEAGAAVALGTVRGARLALGGDGILHVVWNGSSKVPPTASGSPPLLYARSRSGGDGFEPQRAVGGMTRHLDGGAAVAADGASESSGVPGQRFPKLSRMKVTAGAGSSRPCGWCPTPGLWITSMRPPRAR